MKTAELHMFSVKSDRDQTQPDDSAGKRAREIPALHASSNSISRAESRSPKSSRPNEWRALAVSFYWKWPPSEQAKDRRLTVGFRDSSCFFVRRDLFRSGQRRWRGCGIRLHPDIIDNHRVRFFVDCQLNGGLNWCFFVNAVEVNRVFSSTAASVELPVSSTAGPSSTRLGEAGSTSPEGKPRPQTRSTVSSTASRFSVNGAWTL